VGFRKRANGFPRPKDHHATGKKNLVTTTSKEASESALWALALGGNAADAYLTATLTQTVVEHGLTSLGGGFSVSYYDAATGDIASVVGPLGPAKDGKYDFDRKSPVTQTGRAMPVPGFLSGVQAAHKRFGKLKWGQLFGPAKRSFRNSWARPSSESRRTGRSPSTPENSPRSTSAAWRSSRWSGSVAAIRSRRRG